MNALLRFMTEQLWAMEPGVLQSAAAVLERHLAGAALTKDQVEAVKTDRDRRRSARMSFLAAAAPMGGGKEKGSTCQSYRVGSVAVVPIEGMLANHASMVNDISQPDGMTHADVIEQIRAAVADPSARSIMLAIDSPGGTVQGTPGLAAAVRAAREEKPVVAMCMGVMASAAYWVGSQAQEVYCDSPTDKVGSIGCYMVATDTSAAMATAGIKKVLIKAGEFKAGVIPGLPISDSAIGEMESQLGEVLRVFSADVAAARGMSQQKATSVSNGRVYIGQQCIDAGLADGIKPAANVLAYMEDEFGSGQKTQRGFTQTPAHQRTHAMAKDTSPAPEKSTKAADPTPVVGAATMPDGTTPAIPAAPVAAVGTPATFAELKAVFGGKPGGAEHIVESMDKGTTMVQALTGWNEKLEARIAAADEKAKNPATPTASTATGGTVTVAHPVFTVAKNPAAQAKGDGPADFAAAVAQVLKTNADLKTMPKAKAEVVATGRATKLYPELHAAWRASDFPALKIA